MKNTAQRIERLRKEKNYTQDYMATKLNISQQAYQKIESGENNITIERLVAIASLLDTTPNHLLNFNEKTLLINNNNGTNNHLSISNEADTTSNDTLLYLLKESFDFFRKYEQVHENLKTDKN